MMSPKLAQPEHPFTGTWVANLTKSICHPHNRFCSATLQITVHADTITLRHLGINELGEEEEAVNAMLVDGKEHPRPGGHAFTATWLYPRVLEVIDKKDGRIEGRGTYEVSADGKTLTIAADQQVIVCERFDNR